MYKRQVETCLAVARQLLAGVASAHGVPHARAGRREERAGTRPREEQVRHDVPAEHHRTPPTAVSYTHLDVYKRQQIHQGVFFAQRIVDAHFLGFAIVDHALVSDAIRQILSIV